MRRAGVIMVLLTGLAGCDVVAPTRLTSPIGNDASPASVLNAAAVVLQREGYTIAALEPEIGVLSTGWLDETSYADQVFFETSRRSRVSVVLDFLQGQLDVQMTVQKKEYDLPWRNDDLNGGERRRLEGMVEAIQGRIGPAAAAKAVFD